MLETLVVKIKAVLWFQLVGQVVDDAVVVLWAVEYHGLKEMRKVQCKTLSNLSINDMNLLSHLEENRS